MNDGLETLLDRLADGKSPQAVRRWPSTWVSAVAAVWKRIEQLRAAGVEAGEARPGGYQLSKPA